MNAEGTAPSPATAGVESPATAGDLKRSSKLVDFSRERSFVLKSRGTIHQLSKSRDSMPGQQPISSKKREGSAGGAGKKAKPTLEIYRPPTRMQSDSVQNGSAIHHLNVHAKEFSANKSHNQQQSRGTHSQHASGIITSKSSGSLAMHPGGVGHRPSSSSSTSSSSSAGSSKPAKKKALPLSRSSGDLRALQQLPQRAVHFFSGMNDEQKQKVSKDIQTMRLLTDVVELKITKTGKKQLQTVASSNVRSKEKEKTGHQGQRHAAASQIAIQPSPTLPRVAGSAMNQVSPFVSLKRSKSMSAASEFAPCSDAPDLGPFSPQVQAMIHQAIHDPNELPARALMELVRNIFERIAEDRKFALPAAKLCITIIEKEHQQETFLESLLNTCLQWYRQREQEMQLAMKGSSTSPGSATKWLSFLSFLNEMYQQLKRRELQLQTKTEGVAPDLFLLGLMHGCLLSSLDTPAALNSLVEIDSIFIIIMCIGSDLEREQPQRMLSLMASVRDALLALDVVRIPKNRRTLLELVEVRAASWKLPAPAVMYYYPASTEH